METGYSVFKLKEYIMIISGISYTNIKTNNQTKRALTFPLYIWPCDSLPFIYQIIIFTLLFLLCSLFRTAMAAAKGDGGDRRPFSLLFLHLTKTHLLPSLPLDFIFFLTVQPHLRFLVSFSGEPRRLTARKR